MDFGAECHGNKTGAMCALIFFTVYLLTNLPEAAVKFIFCSNVGLINSMYLLYQLFNLMTLVHTSA